MKKIRQAIKLLLIKLNKEHITFPSSFTSSFSYILPPKNPKKYSQICKRGVIQFCRDWIIKSCLHYLKNPGVVRSYKYRRAFEIFSETKKITKHTGNQMSKSVLERTYKEIKQVNQKLTQNNCESKKSPFSKNTRKIVRANVDVTREIEKAIKFINNEKHHFSKECLKEITNLLVEVEVLTYKIYSILEWEEVEVAQKSYKFTLKCLKSLEFAIKDAVQCTENKEAKKKVVDCDDWVSSSINSLINTKKRMIKPKIGRRNYNPQPLLFYDEDLED
jgi:hypothetical protein